MNDYEKQVFRSAISKYGETVQIVVAIEEMSELIKALCKLLRGKPDYENIAEEMADAGIMLDQLSIMEQNADRVRKRRNEKVRRLKVQSDSVQAWGWRPRSCDADWWSVEPDVGRVAHGIPNRVDRLKCLGNAVVPQQFYPIFKAIAETERMMNHGNQPENMGGY